MIIEVEGVAEYTQALARLENNLQHVMQLSGQLSATTVIGTARPTVPVLSGAAARSLAVKDYSDGAAATGGSQAVPYYVWLEFGGDAGIHGSVHRDHVPDGRFLHPAYLQDFTRIEMIMANTLTSAIRGAGLS